MTNYYDNPMKLKIPGWANLLDKYLQNPTREQIASKFGLEGGSCLDVACGDGELLNKYLSNRYSNMVGVDISDEQIGVAKNGANKNTKFYKSEVKTFLRKLAFDKILFDDVYMLAFLEHTDWPVEILMLVSEILKKNGRLVVEVPNVAWLTHRLSLFLGRFPETASTQGVIPGVHDEHLRFFTLSSLDKVCAKTGYVRINFDVCGRLRTLKSLWPKILSPDIIAVYKKK